MIWPVVDDEWRIDGEPAPAALRRRARRRLTKRGCGPAGRSELGGFAVLWGEHDAIRELLAQAAEAEARGARVSVPAPGTRGVPLAAARGDFAEGAGRSRGPRARAAARAADRRARAEIWNPIWSDPAEILAYTLGDQVTTTFDFTCAVEVALRELGPDHLVLLGPGDTLGGAIGQILIEEKLAGDQVEDGVPRAPEERRAAAHRAGAAGAGGAGDPLLSRRDERQARERDDEVAERRDDAEDERRVLADPVLEQVDHRGVARPDAREAHREEADEDRDRDAAPEQRDLGAARAGRHVGHRELRHVQDPEEEREREDPGEARPVGAELVDDGADAGRAGPAGFLRKPFRSWLAKRDSQDVAIGVSMNTKPIVPARPRGEDEDRERIGRADRRSTRGASRRRARRCR